MLIERLRRALASEYAILREIAGGGMGLVFEARQLRLDRIVAIKILRPEFATAIGAERFQAEGRLLARLNHPNIVPIYDAGEADGLLYYVMELIEGETLAQRLGRGPLAPAQAVRLARDLLAALATAHSQDIVHRDVKPANIFLRNGVALLGDFGIARWTSSAEAGLTVPGQLVGTPRYMSPEQQVGGPATPGTDVYAAGLVIYEACTGERWPTMQLPERGDWSKVPAELQDGLRRALSLDAGERWPDARAFAAALAPVRRRRSWMAALGVAGAIGLVLLLRPWGPPSFPPPSGGVVLALERFTVEGGPDPGSLGDSVANLIAASLAGYHDFAVYPPGKAAPDSGVVRIGGTLTMSGDPLQQLRISARGSSVVSGVLVQDSAFGSSTDWAVLADSVATGLLNQLWRGEAGSNPLLPIHALPESARGYALWKTAEQSYSGGRWEAASQEYLRAIQADSTCFLCDYRLLDIDRWLASPPDSQRVVRLRGALDRFPAHYQALIQAALTPPPKRLDLLGTANQDYQWFFLASFEYADELFHRGPEYGFRRGDARAPLEHTVALRPNFGPGWEHLTWLLLSEGDSASAGAALDSLQQIPLLEPGFSRALRIMLELGYHWRFLPSDTAEVFSRAVLSDPRIRSNSEASAGARLMMTADAPRGAVRLGQLLAAGSPGSTEAIFGGLLGQLLGYAALGRLDSVRITGIRAGQATADRSLSLLALELEAVLRAFDPDSEIQRAPELAARLQRYLGEGPPLSHRAAWALGVLAARRGDMAGANSWRAALKTEPAPAPLRGILEAMITGSAGTAGKALRMLPVLPSLETPGGQGSPLAYAVARFLRGEWQAQSGNTAEALKTLLWYEHLQTIGHLTGETQAGEMGWAVGTLARWKRAGLLDPQSSAFERCSAYRAVARLWAGGEPRFKARAQTARDMVDRDCAATP